MLIHQDGKSVLAQAGVFEVGGYFVQGAQRHQIAGDLACGVAHRQGDHEVGLPNLPAHERLVDGGGGFADAQEPGLAAIFAQRHPVAAGDVLPPYVQRADQVEGRVSLPQVLNQRLLAGRVHADDVGGACQVLEGALGVLQPGCHLLAQRLVALRQQRRCICLELAARLVSQQQGHCSQQRQGHDQRSHQQARLQACPTPRRRWRLLGRGWGPESTRGQSQGRTLSEDRRHYSQDEQAVGA